MTVIQGNLDWIFAQDNRALVGSDLLWYPLEGDNQPRQAPDVMVVFGVPIGDRHDRSDWPIGLAHRLLIIHIHRSRLGLGLRVLWIDRLKNSRQDLVRKQQAIGIAESEAIARLHHPTRRHKVIDGCQHRGDRLSPKGLAQLP